MWSDAAPSRDRGGVYVRMGDLKRGVAQGAKAGDSRLATSNQMYFLLLPVTLLCTRMLTGCGLASPPIR